MPAEIEIEMLGMGVMVDLIVGWWRLGAGHGELVGDADGACASVARMVLLAMLSLLCVWCCFGCC